MEFLSETNWQVLGATDVSLQQNVFLSKCFVGVTYVLFDLASANLHVFHLEGDIYQPVMANEQDYIWISAMQLFIGIWQSTRLETANHWLR